MRVYISGPMTGIPEWNFPAFNEAAKRLRDAGHQVINPAETDDGDTSKPREYYIRKDVEHVLSAEAVAVLPGWQRSTGAQLEVEIARQLGLPILDASTMIPADQSESINAEADRLIHGDRRGDYGHPLDDYGRVTGAFNAMTGHALTVEQAILFMQCVKLSRQQNRPKRDNLVDLAGYTGLLEMIAEERERRLKPK